METVATKFSNPTVVPIKLDGKPEKSYFLFSQVVDQSETLLKVNLVLSGISDNYEAIYETNDLQSTGKPSLEAFQQGNWVDKQRQTKYVFILDNDGSSSNKYRLTWKLVKIDADGEELLRKPVDSVKLIKKDSQETIAFLLKEMTNQLKMKDDSIKKLSVDKEELQANCTEAVEQLKTFAQAKEESYAKLCTEFTGLLNEKKKMIRDLLNSGNTFGNTFSNRCYVWEPEIKNVVKEKIELQNQKRQQRTEPETSKSRGREKAMKDTMMLDDDDD